MKKDKNKNIIIAVSGTGGHIYPGIALAREFQSKGCNPIFFINNNSASLEILNNSGFQYVAFNMVGMPRKFSFSFIVFLAKLKISFLKALKQILYINPAAVIGTGGYLAVPVLFAAKTLGKKIFIHEQNTIPGKANILLNKIADETFVSFSFSTKYFKNKNLVVSGYPVRKDILSVSKNDALKMLSLNDNIFTVLIFGGSLGAVKLNEVTCKALLRFISSKEMQVIHITGAKDFARIQDIVGVRTNYRIFNYMHNIAYAYAACDMVISRSGAGTVFELKALGKTAILIPYPYATDNHQYWNAKEIEEKGKVKVIEEKDFTEKNLLEAVEILKINAKKAAVKNIVKQPQEIIYEEITKCIKS
ncbi:undecaprenyldiphospho-muramoylpentapeptide beta-N-acetylglucosaminyltransferase [Candidatus Endomicrobiellum devescovinae]|jgi:UDP-N-acetylglucosamine--N-acetylmuramyl-(pentapeptide) pyrophosphoryl-undecaprenol N-acetylglucosamine transferase|uniref:undecaprenyldiphospho-muramoylpentapeptide beta-N-acetylglucosaminyltransferase n=1 Tax=Candidatus Endomicrobiellum devescovinae TaxID=3242322 RepID=UPI00282AC86F|nr:undecaprenyldiphospho-muramoylpentapeptide beta-N-acetylglucosaminyltransferase [Endomicrobium sp.]